MILSTEKKIDLIDLALDSICSGCNPAWAFTEAGSKLDYSTFTIIAMIELENFANGGPFFVSDGTSETRINRLRKLRNYLQKALEEEKDGRKE